MFQLEGWLLPLRPLITQRRPLPSILPFVVATLAYPQTPMLWPVVWPKRWPDYRCHQHLTGISLQAIVCTGEA
jgi:hypothetical protein